MSRFRKPQLVDYIVCYMLYATLFVLGYVTVFSVWRQAILTLLVATLDDTYTIRTIYLVSILLMGIVLFVMVFVAEIYLRDGIPRQQLRRRYTRLAVPLLVICLLGMLVRALSLASL